MLLAFYKPYGVVSQFTRESESYATLVDYRFPKGVYPIGRLDADSEGLLLLSDEPALNQRLLDPEAGHTREYWVQVERIPEPESIQRMTRGLMIQGRRTLPCRAWKLETAPELPERTPPIRFRKSIPTCWLAIELVEGKNRQVRRMTAAIGHPTLRLVRWRIGAFTLASLKPGEWSTLSNRDRMLVVSG